MARQRSVLKRRAVLRFRRCDRKEKSSILQMVREREREVHPADMLLDEVTNQLASLLSNALQSTVICNLADVLRLLRRRQTLRQRG